MEKNLADIIKEIQFMQNEYVRYKKLKNPLGMLTVMWEIGDYLHRIGIKNPHSLGWEIQRQGAYIKRPMVFRSHVLRRIWNSKEKMQKDLYDIKSVNSVIELFPFLDQNNKWKLPKNQLDELLYILNTKSTKQFNAALCKIKSQFIGIKTDRERHLSELDEFKKLFYEFFNDMKSLIENSSIEKCKHYKEKIGKENLKNIGTICLYLGTERPFNIKDFKINASKDEKFKKFSNEMMQVCINKDRQKRVKRVIKTLDLVAITDFCNSILSDEGVKSYRKRANVDLSI